MDQVKGLIGNLEKKGEVIQAKIQQKFERKLGSSIRWILSNKKRLPVAKNGYLPFSNVAWQKQDALTSSAHAFRSSFAWEQALSIPCEKSGNVLHITRPLVIRIPFFLLPLSFVF